MKTRTGLCRQWQFALIEFLLMWCGLGLFALQFVAPRLVHPNHEQNVLCCDAGSLPPANFVFLFFLSLSLSVCLPLAEPSSLFVITIMHHHQHQHHHQHHRHHHALSISLGHNTAHHSHIFSGILLSPSVSICLLTCAFLSIRSWCSIASKAWTRWVLELPYNQDAPAKCEDGEVMTKIDKQQYRMLITCSKLRTEGSCIHRETPLIDVSASYINNAYNLWNTKMECPTGYAMSFWKTQTFGDEATSINFAYTCCAAGSGFRSATVWNGPDASHFESWEGVYCPEPAADSGYLDYIQRTRFGGGATGARVELNKTSGKWCLSTTSTCLEGDLLDSPSVQDTWQANPVNNFDGDCVEGQVTQPLPFKKSQLSSHPEVVYFGTSKEAESSYEDPLECSPTQSGTLPANHPCKAVWENKITMEQIFDCFDRETARQENLRYLSWQMYNQKSKTEMREAYSGGACASIPDIQSTAYTPGNMLTPGRVCQVGNDLVFLNKKFAEGDSYEELEKSFFASSNADCAGTKLGLAKVFCDLHCIKSAIAEDNEDLADLAFSLEKFAASSNKQSKGEGKKTSANATRYGTSSASFSQGSVRARSAAAVVSQRAAMFSQRSGKLLQLRKQAVKAHEDAVKQVKDRQRRLTSQMTTAEQIEDHSTRQLMMELDSTWWSIRSAIDSHLHAARQFQSGFSDSMALLQGFSEQCSVQWHDVLKGYDKLSLTETEFQKSLRSMWLEVVPKAGLLSDQLLHGDAFSRLLEFDANSLDMAIVEGSKDDDLDTSSDCVNAMTLRLHSALGQGFAHQMLLQVRAVFAELASLRDRFHFEGMGEPEDSQLLAGLLQQAEKAYETTRTVSMPKLVQQIAKTGCERHMPRHWEAPAEVATGAAWCFASTCPVKAWCIAFLWFWLFACSTISIYVYTVRLHVIQCIDTVCSTPLYYIHSMLWLLMIFSWHHWVIQEVFSWEPARFWRPAGRLQWAIRYRV